MAFTNTLYTNDNLFILNGLNSKLVNLIYLAPPFNSKRFYSAPIDSKAAGTSFKDMWNWEDVNTLAEKFPALAEYIASIGAIHSDAMKAYLTYMAQRIIEMHCVLKDTGSLYLHCDPTASHYLKVVLDEIFGKNIFRNEIIWHYRRWTGKAKKFQSLHDVIFFYTKSDEYTFNEQYTPYTNKSLKRKQNYHTRIKGDDVFVTSIDEKGVRENDVWVDIQLLNSQSEERTGYPTQKPLSLLHRIIKSSSNEGDIVLDPFCGCATTCVAAQQLDRKWIGIDIERQAVNILIERLSNDAGMFKDFANTEIVPQRTDIQKIEPTKTVKERLYQQQSGGDNYENYQLLCSNCNRMKSDNPMESLRLKIKIRSHLLNRKIIFGK